MRFLCYALAGLLVLGQTQPQTFRSGVEVVTVDVLVTRGNRPVAGLKARDFTLQDNGVPQTVTSVALGDVPFSLLLALDTSSSLAGRPLADLRDAARAAVEALRPDDHAALLTFSHVLNRRVGWTTNAAALDRGIDATQAGGSTALFDATYAGLAMRNDEAGRRALMLLFTDGDDTASWLPADAVLDEASRSDMVVYGVAVDPPDVQTVDGHLNYRSGVRLKPDAPLMRQEPFLPELAARTGGDVFIAGNTGRLRETFQKVITEFRNRYVLTYTPQNVDVNGWHAIDVKVRGKNLTVKARRGYLR